jgi:carboxypeptidase D
VEKGLIEEGSDIHKELSEMMRTCHTRIANEPGLVDYRECEDILNRMLRLTSNGQGDDACINMYDVRLKDSYPSCGMHWPPDLEFVTPYLRRNEVVDALHVNKQRTTGWQECSGSVGSAFQTRNSGSSVDLLPGLAAEISVLLFSGAEDLICNHVGTEDMLSELEWNGGRGFEVSPGNWAPRREWTFEGENAGFWQEARNLTYVLFQESSHMVPFDYPRRSRDMLDRFMGVDITTMGGEPTDSRIDGERGPNTTFSDANGDNETQKEVDDAKWEAYRRSGEIVLIIVIIAAVGWGYFIWRERRKRAAYQAVNADEPIGNGTGLTGFRRKRGPGDLEAAAFDESELDEFHENAPEGGRYSIGDDSDEETAREKSGKGKNASASTSS